MSPLETRPEWHLCLDKEELARIMRIRDQTVKKAKLAAHVLLRVLLSRIDGTHPSIHALCRDHFGRPSPRRLPDWSCSLSHDPFGVAVAIGRSSKRETQLGVDLCRPLKDHNGLSFVLDASEKQSLHSNTESNASLMALYWASKEALLKRWGWGLIPSLDRITTIPGMEYERSFHPPLFAKPATTSAITSRILENGVAVALAHHPYHVAEWWRTNAAELDKATSES